MPPVVIDLHRTEDTRDVVHRAVQALVEGKLVAFPTETVYGLAASALSEKGVARLLAAKNRAVGHPLALAVKSAEDAEDYVPDICPLGRRLARRCWPGPVTLVVEDEHPASLIRQLPKLARDAIVPSGTVGLRVPAHTMVLDVLRLLVGPMALSSANRGGERESLTAAEVVAAMNDDVDLLLDDGRSRFGQPSSVVRVSDDGFEVLREGVVSGQTLFRLASTMILLVCTGNTCRSPMAEALLRRRLAERSDCQPGELEDHGVIVMSAGLAATMGARPTAEAVDAMTRLGLDLTAHVSQPLTEQLVRHADLVLVMTAAHRQAIVAQWPDAAERVKLLCHDNQDVADPIGGPPDVYRQCAQQIDGELSSWVEKLELPQGKRQGA
jgi:protein-tyrosine phosphatase